MADGIELASAYVSILPSTKGLGKGITRAMGDAGTSGGKAAGSRFRSMFRRGSNSAAKDTETRFAKTAKTMAKLFAGAFVIKKGISFITGTASAYKGVVGEAVKLRRFLGGSVEDASRLRFVAQQTGIDSDKFAKGLGIFNRNLVGGKLDGFAASMKAGQKGAADLGRAQERLAKARQKLTDLEAIQGSKSKHTVADSIALRNAQDAVAGAQRDVAAAGKPAATAMDTLGFKTRDAHGKLLPMSKILPSVAERFKNMADGPEKTALAMKLFGKSGADLMPFLNKGADGIDALMKKADELGVTLGDDDVAAMKKANENSRLWKASLESVRIQIGRYVLPVLTKFTGFLANKMPRAIAFVRQVLGVLFKGDFAGGGPFQEDSPFIGSLFRLRATVQRTFTLVRKAFTRGVDAVKPFVSAVINFFKKDPKARFAGLAVVLGGVLLSAVLAISSALIGLFSPIYLVVGAVAAVAFGIVYAYKRFSGFRAVVDGVARWLVGTAWPMVKQFGLSIRDLFVRLVGWVRSHWGQIKAGVKVVVDWFRNTVVPIVRNVVGGILQKWKELVAYTRRIWPEVREAIGNAIGFITRVVGAGVRFIGDLWSKWGGNLRRIVQTVWSFIKSTISNALQLIRGIIKTVTSLIRGDWSGAWEGLKQVAGALLKEIGAIISRGLGLVRQVFGMAVDLIVVVWDRLWSGIKTVVGGAITWVHHKVNSIAGFFTSIPGKIADQAKGMFDGVKNAFRSMLNWIIDAWNGLEFKIPGFDPPGPGPKFPGFTLGMPDLPKFHSGGVVPGPLGQEVPIMALAGERVSPISESESPRRGRRPGRRVETIHQHFYQPAKPVDRLLWELG